MMIEMKCINGVFVETFIPNAFEELACLHLFYRDYLDFKELGSGKVNPLDREKIIEFSDLQDLISHEFVEESSEFLYHYCLTEKGNFLAASIIEKRLNFYSVFKFVFEQLKEDITYKIVLCDTYKQHFGSATKEELDYFSNFIDVFLLEVEMFSTQYFVSRIEKIENTHKERILKSFKTVYLKHQVGKLI